ncbi:Lipopolysaccharide export system permease protein LptG [Candidatus Erwinia haradaeae]|uniref:Lipopolysaccharide export system permease protein LptG n=1 Tax=Candidatus Erwinia haradaeae TaxID=1922217 RepID=A0A451DDM9_9GAMM|nr:LPS export ABC transporter permease LptG [Candidatus Erwinia haradaeae]VFP84501.1 Lipopolysaccharide export system permease protein LptG [Candidatus Erwinia haradaeae]
MVSVFDKYIGKIIAYHILSTLLMLTSLSSMIKFVDQLRKTGQGEYNLLSAALYTILSIPKDIEVFFPMGALLGTLIGLGLLTQNRELIAMEAAGFTRMKIIGSVMKITLPLIVLMMLVGEFLAPIGEDMARNYRIKKLMHTTAYSTPGSVWIRENTNFIFIERIHDNNHITGISMYIFSQNKRLHTVQYAKSGKYNINKKLWDLAEIYQSDLNQKYQIINTHTLHNEWKTSITPNKLRILALNPDTLSIRGLYSYLKYLHQSGQQGTRHQLSMWGKIFQPLSLVVMMLMSLSLIFGPLQSTSMGVKIVTGISFGFLFYVLNQIFGLLSLVYHASPILGALLPSTLFFVISITILVIWKKQRI